ncbi:MAG: radical SAM protein [Candidatus Aminicenantes bacterium]
MVSIEITNACNLECIMCARNKMSRDVGFMDFDLYCKIIDECAERKPVVLLPQGFGESLLHPRWVEMIKYAKDRSVEPIVLITNGTVLNEKNISALLDLELDQVVISIDGVNKNTFERIRRGADFERVTENVMRLIEFRKERNVNKPSINLRIIQMKETEAEIEPFFEKWQPLLGPGDEVSVNAYNTWAGAVEDRSVKEKRIPETKPCKQLWKMCFIYWNGDVAPCCVDYDGELVIGNVRDSSIADIWRSKKLREMRRTHLCGRRDKYPLCARCPESG